MEVPSVFITLAKGQVINVEVIHAGMVVAVVDVDSGITSLYGITEPGADYQVALPEGQETCLP